MEDDLLYGPFLVGNVFDGIVESEEFDAFFLGVFHLFQTGGHFGLTAAVDDVYLFSPQAFGCAAGVHSRVAATYHHDTFGGVEGSVGFGIGGVHQVDARQVLVARHDVHAVLAGDVHKVGQAGTRGDEYAFVPFFLEFFHTFGLADDAVLDELHAHLLEVVDFHVHDLVGQAELGDTIFQYAANLVQGFEDGDVVAILHHVACKAQSGRTRTHDGHLDVVLGGQFGQDDVAALALIIGYETLQVADGYGGFVHLQVDALAFALLLLRADASADGGQRRGVLQHAGRLEKLAALYVLDERGDVDADGAALHTRGVGTVQTTFGLGHGLFLGVACVYFFRAGGSAVDGVEFVHRAAGDGGAFLRLHALAQGLTPGSFAVEKFFHRGVVRHGPCSRRYGWRGFSGDGMADRCLQMAHFFTFHVFERSHALEHLVPFHLVTVEFRTVHTDKFGLSAHGDAAGTTHSCSVDHDGVQ